MRLVLLGPPGAGKGSLALRLKDRWGLAHVASGDLLREAVRARTPLGRQVQGSLARGALVPDPVVEQLVFERLRGVPRQPGFVLDGFPRTEAQAQALDQVLAADGASLDRVLDLETSPEMIVRRLAGRRVCRACGANYHVTNMPPAREGSCDRCEGALEQRQDDRPDTIRQRLQVYAEQTAPLLAYYRARGVLRTLDGQLDIEPLVAAFEALSRREGWLAG